RAEALSVVLSTKNIAAIFSTNTLRTTQTATPLSNATGKPITLYSNDTMSLFVNRLQQFRSNVLVVGHSNTVLQLLDSFHLAHNIQNIADNDFDNLFIIKTKRFFRTSTSLTETTYGALSP
ncbi:MAG: histidine phosphatase family protein, partial [Panacibacter sp.]